MVNPYIIPKSTAPKISNINKSAGILDDFAIRKNVATKEGTIEHTPTEDNHIVNKKYVDDNAGGGVDWTISQTPAIIHADNYTDNDTTYESVDFNHNALTNTHNLTTDINHDTINNYVANEHIDWTTDQGATNIHSGNYTDTNTTYTGGTNLTLSGTTFNVDDAFLVNNANDTTTGTITAAGFTSSSGNLTLTSGNLTNGTNSLTIANAKTAYDHSQSNTQAHTDYLLNNGNDTTTGVITMAGGLITGDASSADTAYVPMVLYNTDATPPAASGFPVGTLYVQYTA